MTAGVDLINGICVNAFEDSAPPWRNEVLWHAAIATLKYLVHRHGRQMDPVKETANRILILLDGMDEALEGLCRITCTRCTTPCCRVADVSYDFRDLLLIVLTHRQVPSGQPRRTAGEVCRYLDETGCRIKRRERPWICTWYICAEQKNFIKGNHQPASGRLADAIATIGTLRKAMENRFISIVADT